MIGSDRVQRGTLILILKPQRIFVGVARWRRPMRYPIRATIIAFGALGELAGSASAQPYPDNGYYDQGQANGPGYGQQYAPSQSYGPQYAPDQGYGPQYAPNQGYGPNPTPYSYYDQNYAGSYPGYDQPADGDAGDYA